MQAEIRSTTFDRSGIQAIVREVARDGWAHGGTLAGHWTCPVIDATVVSQDCSNRVATFYSGVALVLHMREQAIG